MDKAYYIDYFDLERNNWWFKARLEIIHSQIKKIVKDNNQLRILNIGVATGATSVMLQEFGTVKSVEFDTDCIAFVKERLTLDIEPGDITQLRFEDETFDLVCAFDVVEHVKEDQKAVHEMFRVCKTGGTVFVSVPAFSFLWGQHDVVNHHCRRYTRGSLNKLFPRQRILFSTYMNTWLFLPIVLLRWLSKIVKIKRARSGSDFDLLKSDVYNRLFYKIFISENRLIKKGISLPFGVSVFTLAKK